MPIKPENKARYPANWKDIRAAILERAGNCCEWPGCGVHNHSEGFWNEGEFINLPAQLRVGSWKLGDEVMIAEGAEIKVIRIVLTIAHLDHTPEHNDPSNLMAMCQRHHLAYDQAHHATNAYMTRKAKANTLELPL